MNEIFNSKPEVNDDKEPTPEEVIQKAIAAGYIEQIDVDTLGVDIEDIIGSLYGIIIEAGDDPDEVFAQWGIVA